MDEAPEVTTGEPIAASNWLDRLRSSKGFNHPSNSLNLNNFLPSSDDLHSQVTPNSAHSKENHPENRSSCVRGKNSHWSDIQCILSDLFNIEGYPQDSQFTTKAARKQSRPRFIRPGLTAEDDFIPPQRFCKEEASLASFSSLFSGADCGADEGYVNSVEDCGFRGYSKIEVTVIDTSCEEWKFEKVLLRRKSAWKVRDLYRANKSNRKKNKKKMTLNGNTEKMMKKKRKRLEVDDC